MAMSSREVVQETQRGMQYEGMRDVGAVSENVMLRELRSEVARLRAELATTRDALETTQVRLRREMSVRHEAEQLAAEAAKSSTSASNAAVELRSQLLAATQRASTSEQQRKAVQNEVGLVQAELSAARSKIHGGWAAEFISSTSLSILVIFELRI